MYAPDVETEEWGLFPREREGNIYVHNWSLVEDGVVPTKGLFRNARVQVLTNAIGAKAQDNKLDLKAPAYFGKYALLESGLGLTHEHFSEIFNSHQENLSLESQVYAEDAVVGAHRDMRNGVRVATNIPAVALLFRTLLVSVPLFLHLSIFYSLYHLFLTFLPLITIDSFPSVHCEPHGSLQGLELRPPLAAR